MAEVGLVLLVHLDVPDDRAVTLDDEGLLLGIRPEKVGV